VYPLLIIGWASNRKYALIGAIRGVAQTISYEIRLGLVIIVFIVYFIGLASSSSVNYRFRLIFYWPCLATLWLIILLAETNRTPFDFSEGESELVSGFNVEYSATGFVLIFLREYAIIIIFSCLRVSIFCGLELFRLFSRLLSLIISSFWFILRATLPRYRYDLLINLAWKRYLPIRLIVTIISALVYMV
jgi:NADH-ubiquinone oxidoreductase chain 1